MKNQNQSPQEPLTQKEIIAFLRTHKDKLERDFGVTQIALFGSYARGEQGPTSDIDFVIEMPEPSFKNHCRLKEFLENHLKKLDFKILSNLDEKSISGFDCICIVQHHTKTKHILDQFYTKSLVSLIYDCQNKITHNPKSNTVLKGFGRLIT